MDDGGGGGGTRESGLGAGVVTGSELEELTGTVDTDVVVNCKAEDKAADREATEPTTEDIDVDGLEVEKPGRLYR